MRNFKKRTIALCLASAITVLGSFASDTYQNSLMSLRIDSGSKNNVSFTAFTKKPYNKMPITERYDENTYYVIFPGTNSEVTAMPSIVGYDNIDSMQIATFPYTAEEEGYTRVTIKTKGNPVVSAITSLYIPSRSDAALNTASNVLSTESNTAKTPEKKPEPKQQSSYWDKHESNQPSVKPEEEKPSENKASKSEASFKHQNTQAEDFNPNFDTMSTGSSGERLPVMIGVIVLAFLIIFIVFLNKDKMASIVGDQKDFDFDDNEENKQNSKSKKIRASINQLDNKYKNKTAPVNINANIASNTTEESDTVVEKTFKDEHEEVVVVDLDSLYNEKTKSEQVNSGDNTQENDTENDAEDDLAGFLDEFSFEEEVEEPEQTFDEELYESTINNSQLNFSDADSQRLSKLIQNEIGDDTLNNIEEFAPKNPIKKTVPKEVEMFENIMSEYVIKQNLSFSKDDVDALRKLMNVEFDDDFVTDLRTNPQRTEEMRKEIEIKEKRPHKTSEMLILNVKDLLPDLSKEMAKHGNKKIESDAKPDVIYYSEGYEVSKLSVSSDLADVSKAMHDKNASKFRPSDDMPIVESGYDVQTLSIKDLLPNIADYKKNPKKYEDKKTTTKVDEKALLSSIENVQFKPFYDNVQEELSQFEGFEIIDNEKEEQKAQDKALEEIENLSKQTVKREKPKQTPKTSDDAQQLLKLIEEKQTERENKKQVENTQKTENNAASKSADIKTKPTVFKIGGSSYNIIKSVACDNKSGCYLAKNENGYSVIGRVLGKYKVLKKYNELKSENLQIRLNEKNQDGSIQYLVKVSAHKFIINVTQNTMEFVMDLC